MPGLLNCVMPAEVAQDPASSHSGSSVLHLPAVYVYNIMCSLRGISWCILCSCVLPSVYSVVHSGGLGAGFQLWQQHQQQGQLLRPGWLAQSAICIFDQGRGWLLSWLWFT